MAELTLRLQSSTGNAVLPNVPAATSFAELCALVATRLGLPHSDFQLLAGFPPRPLQLQAEEAIGGALQNGDSVRVKLASEAAAAAPKQATGKPPKAPGSKRSGKAAATTTTQRTQAGPMIHSLSGPVTPARSSSSGTGAAAAAAPTGSPAAAKKRRRTNIAVHSEEDVTGLMLEAVSGGGGKKNKFMRAVFKRAVDKEYDAAKAQARISSALSSKYEMRDSQNARRLGDGQSTQLHVKFKKGINSRSYFEETVDLLTQDALGAVVMLVLQSPDPDAREMLKPMNMAGCSPRVFWSLVRLFGGDVVDGLRQLLPASDWSFLDERQRFMSEKAKANFEQEQERKLAAEARRTKRKQIKPAGEEDGNKRARRDGEDEEKGQTPIAETPTEIVEEEPQEQESDQEEGAEQSDEELGVEEAKEELEEFVPSELLEYIVSDKVRVFCLRALTKKEPEQLQEELVGAGAVCSEELAQDIVAKAREQSLDEIWFQICHQNDTLVQMLEQLRICTPRDLALWRMSIPELTAKINDELQAHTPSQSSTEPTPEAFTEAQMSSSMRRAQRYRKKYAWLDDWITDVQA